MYVKTIESIVSELMKTSKKLSAI